MLFFNKNNLQKNKIIDIGKQSIITEINGVKNVLENSINDDFFKFIEIIMKTKGKIIFSAIGKPSYIAQKAAATFSSTGTPSIFIHPSEASHGDLGMITKDDIVVALSNSGASSELNDIISYTKRIGIKLVGITRKAGSTLAQSSDLTIILENCPQTNNLNSPTTDIIMFLTYLDAVATVLIDAKKFTNDKYRNFHPGGKLGSSLIKTEEIMRTGNCIPTININKTVPEMLEEMSKKQLGCCAILNNDSKLIGIITDGDLRRKTIEYGDITKRKIQEIMTTEPIYILSKTLAIEAVSIMTIQDKYRQILLVVDEKKKVVGILHIQDLFKARII